MILLSRVDGGRYEVAVHCRVCKEKIRDYRMAMVIFDSETDGSSQFWVCHKGACDEELKTILSPRLPWWELGSFLGRLCASAGVTLDGNNPVVDELYTASRRGSY